MTGGMIYKAYAVASGVISILSDDDDPEQRPEGGMSGAAAVEAEDEFVEVRLQVLAAQAMVDAQGPTFEVREHPMGPGEHDMGGHRADDVRIVGDARRAFVGGPAVGLGGGAGGDIGRDEGVQACGGEAGYGGEPHPAGSAVAHFDGAGDQHLALGAAPVPAFRRIGLAAV